MRTRWGYLVFAAVVLIPYFALVINLGDRSYEPRLWPDIWNDTWLTVANPVGLCAATGLFIAGLRLIWFSVRKLDSAAATVKEYVFLWMGIALLPVGALGALVAITHSPSDQNFSEGGLGLLLFALFYGSSCLLLANVFPLVPLLFKGSTARIQRLSIVGVLLLVACGLAMSFAGTEATIDSYVGYRYHAG